MSELSRIVSVDITRQTRAVTQKGFGIGLLLGRTQDEVNVLPARATVYSSLNAVSEDYASTTEVYKAAAAYFGASIKPESLIVGFQRGTETISEALTAIKNENSDFYAVAMISQDPADQLALAAAIEADCRIAGVRTSDPETLSATESGSLVEQFVLQEGTTGEDHDVAGDSQGILTLAGGANYFYTNVTDGANTQNDPGLSGNDNVVNILLADDAESILTKMRDAIFLSGDVNVLTAVVDGNVLTVTYVAGAISPDGSAQDLVSYFKISEEGTAGGSPNDIGFQLNQLQRERTFVIYGAQAIDEYPEFAWLGKALPKTPGSVTWKFKSLSGVTPDQLSDTDISVLQSKNVNFYHIFGGAAITEDGKMASGEFIDIIRGVDLIQARMQEAIFGTLVNVDKIPFTNDGVNIVVNQMAQVLDRATDVQGILSGDPRYTITAPDVRDVPFNDRAERCLPDLFWDAILAGAVHQVKIQGNVSV